jgi:molybdate transport system substrate-binding protein
MSQSLSTLVALLFLLSSFPAHPATLTVAAASDLTNVEPDLAAVFRKNEPNLEVKFVTGASAALMQQIESGAPYDVFLSANARYAEQLASNGKLAPGSLAPYAVGRVGILWRDGKPHNLTDLRQDWVRIVALPNPKLAPYGAAAQQALQHAGLWQTVSKKAVYGENVRQALQIFESGNADVVLTSDSLLGGKDADLIPSGWHDPIVQKAGVVAASSNQEAARRFLNFLLGPDAQAVFTRFGFSKP